MVLQHIEADGQLDALLATADYKLVVVDFYASWCPPCRLIAPIFEQLSNYYNNVIFAKVDVDRCRMTCQAKQINAMPTFLFFVRGQEVDRLQGANGDRLRQLIDLHMKDPPKAVSGTAANPPERQWLHFNLVSRVDHVNQYEDEVNQMLALSVIPLEEINERATVDGKLTAFNQAKYLMDWFHSFFSWVNNPKCQSCGDEDTKKAEDSTCTSDESARGGGRVEVFECNTCSCKTRFVRYNNPVTLIETREGRCGEWANCFTLCCRAIGLEARYIHGTEDHVWTEIYDQEKKRWIHCDPCENVIDRPLLYEKGWNKPLKYAFGVAHDHVQDVTWRYTYDHRACMKRRTYCREPVLLNCMAKLNLRLQKNLPEERQKELKDRQLVELIAFLSPKLNLRGPEEEQGRTSGDVSWRVARGEAEMPKKQKVHVPAIITPTDAEIKAKSMIIEYDCVNNVYRRPNDNKSQVKGFLSLMHQADNVTRKVENDWKMAYICRNKDSKSADFSWKFSFGDQKVKRVHVSLGEFATYASGRGMATVCGGDLCTMLEKNNEVELSELCGAEYIELSINLRGGDGDVAWQHAQLFRTSLDKPHANLRVVIEFE